MEPELTQEEAVAILKQLARPIDFDFLVPEGVLTPKGEGWYEVYDLDALPRWLKLQITELCTERGTKPQVKFGVDHDEAAKLYQEMTGKTIYD